MLGVTVSSTNYILDIAKLLIKEGADPKLTDKDGLTALDHAKATLKEGEKEGGDGTNSRKEDYKEVIEYLEGLK